MSFFIQLGTNIMKLYPLQKYVLLFVCIALLASCSTRTKTTIDVSWKDQTYDTAQIKKILIIGLSKDEVVRLAFEDGMQKQLQKRGVNAVIELDDHGKAVRSNSKTFDHYFRSQGIDIVLVSRLVSVDDEATYIPGRVDYISSDNYFGRSFGYDGFNGYGYGYGYYGDFYQYYYPTYRSVYRPGYLKHTTVVRVETNIYETKKNNLVWSAVSKTFDPSNTTDTLKSLNEAISSQLVEDGFFK